MEKIELLAPAGSLDRLKIALIYGADAVYIGGRNYSLRANAKNFSLEEIKEACEFAHDLGKKVYVTVNIIFHNEDIFGLVDYLHELEKYKVDAIIVSDPLVIDIINKNKINLEVHISTQYSTLNKEAIKFWKELGAKRVVLGREASRSEIKEIIDETGMDIEMFLHGAMCSSYSGRCVMSNYFTNRDANRGGCAQICRFVFDLEEDGKKIDSSVKFTMSSKDLCMANYVKDIIDLGVKSLKIEGRMRSIYYIATVISTYRMMIDKIYDNTLTKDDMERYLRVLNRVANRDSTDQFYNSFPGVREQYYSEREESSNQDYLAFVNDYNDGYANIISKNYFKTGDMVELMSPDHEPVVFKIGKMYDMDGNLITISNHPEVEIKLEMPVPTKKYDMIKIHSE